MFQVKLEWSPFWYISYSAGFKVVGTATRYGLHGSGIISRWVWDFPCRQNWPRDTPNLLYNQYRIFPGSKVGGDWCWPPTFFQRGFRTGWNFTSLPNLCLQRHVLGRSLSLNIMPINFWKRRVLAPVISIFLEWSVEWNISTYGVTRWHYITLHYITGRHHKWYEEKEKIFGC